MVPKAIAFLNSFAISFGIQESSFTRAAAWHFDMVFQAKWGRNVEYDSRGSDDTGEFRRSIREADLTLPN
jgi:hypothetical protein